MEAFNNEDIKTFNSYYSKLWKRCRDITEWYYEAHLWIKGINYILDVNVYDDHIEIIEGAHGMDLEFSIEDFVNDEKLIKAIKKDIEENL